MQPILTNIEATVATVTLNRPEVHNAFDERLIAELTAQFEWLGQNPDVRVVVLTGIGKSFCAGADLNWMAKIADYTYEENLADSWALQRMFEAIYTCPKPVIARVNGSAIGGGVGLVAACDIAVCVPEAKFGLSEVRLGLAPAVIGPYVIEKIGVGPARPLFITGERFGAEQARHLMLIDEIAGEVDLDAAVGRHIETLLQAGPNAITAAKKLLREISGKTPAEAANTTVETIARLRVSDEGQSGISAFLGKHKAPWCP